MSLQTTTFSKLTGADGRVLFVNLDNIRHILVTPDGLTVAVYMVGAEQPIPLLREDAVNFLNDITTFTVSGA